MSVLILSPRSIRLSTMAMADCWVLSDTAPHASGPKKAVYGGSRSISSKGGQRGGQQPRSRPGGRLHLLADQGALEEQVLQRYHRDGDDQAMYWLSKTRRRR
jgi:hypothetical protein